MVPMVSEPPGVELTDQDTDVFKEPVTVAVNKYVEPARMLAEAGKTETATDPEGGGLEELEGAEELPQATRSGARRNKESGGRLLE